MNTLRKIIAFTLCLCMILVFASCETVEKLLNKEDPTDPTTTPPTPGDIIGSLSKEEWNSALEEDKFDNVTFSIIITRSGETEPYPIICKLDGEKAAYSEGSWGETEVDAETRDAMKSIYMNTILAMLESFDTFTYDEAAKAYVSANDIVYTVNVMGIDATITTSGTKVKFDTAKNIAEITCHMKQEYVEDGTPGVMEFDAVFSFYDYGTTVVGGATSNDFIDAYEASCAIKNVTVSVYAVETLLDGTQEIDDLVYKTTETRLLMGSNIYSIENGSKYVYNHHADGWTRTPVQTNAPIGALVDQYVGMFESVFDLLTYNEEKGVYGAYDFSINMYGNDMPFSMLEITVTDGLISKLEYITVTYDNSGDTPVVEGEGHATMRFYDYGTTMVDLPSEYTDSSNSNNQGGGNPQVQPTKMSKETWDEIFDQASTETNFTVYQENTRIPFNGETSSSVSILETTETASHTFSPASASETYHSIENGEYYYYFSTDGAAWTKNNANPQSSPIGSAVIKQFTDIFKDVYDYLTYDASQNAYIGSNFMLTQRGMEFTIHDFRIKFDGIHIVEIYYVSDMYGTSNGETVLSGRGACSLMFSNYGTTKVTVPTEYTDNTSSN